MRTALKTIGFVGVVSLGALAGCSASSGERVGRTSVTGEAIDASKRLTIAEPLLARRPGALAHKKRNALYEQATAHANAATNAQLTYQGGPLIQHVKIYLVFWGPSVNSQIQSGMGAYYSDLTSSPYVDWLSEYDTNGMTINRGSLAGTYTISPSNTSSSLQDSDIGTEIDAQISSGALPKNDGDSLYMVYFPAGINISLQGSASCQAFCAFHSGLQRSDGSQLYFGVMPDLGPECGGCGNSAQQFQNTTEVSSHEMIEAITDPGVGVGAIGWYDNTNGEIGDICAWQPGTIDGYTIQLGWSNANDACIDQPQGGGSSSGSSGGGGSNGGGSNGGSSGGSGGGGSSSGGSGGGSSGASSSGSGSSGGGGACAWSEQEPNDTIQYADDLSNGCLSGAIDPGSDVDWSTFQLSGSVQYDVAVAAGGDANVAVYKYVSGQWEQVASTSPTDVNHVSQGGGSYAAVVYSPGQQTQSYTITLTHD